MADEKYSIDIDVNTKDVSKAMRELKRLQKTTKRLQRQTVRASRDADRMARKTASIKERLHVRAFKNQVRSNIALRKNADRIRMVKERAKAADTSLQDMGLGAISASKGLGSIAVKAAVVTAAVTAIGTAAFASAVVGAKDFNRNTVIAFDALTGSAEKGAQALSLSRSIAGEYGQTIQDTTGQFKKLLAAQFSLGEAETFIKLGADLRAIGTDAEGVKSAIRAITQIKAKGRLQADELLQLSEANVSQELIFNELQKSLGVDNADEVRKVIEAGKVKSDQALAAIQGAILKKTGSKEAGDAGRKFADTSIEAMRNRIANAGFSLLGEVADASPEAFTKLAAIGKDIARFFNEFQGKDELSAIFTTAVDALGALVKIGKAFFSGFVDRFAEGSAGISTFMSTLTDPAVLSAFQSIGSAMASIASMTIKAGLAFTQFVTAFNVIREGISQRMLEVQVLFETFGFNIAQGVASGIRNGISSVINAASSIANAAKNQFASLLRIGSPSKVFEGFGGNVVEGFDKGVQTPAVKAASKGVGSSSDGGAGVGTTNNFNMGGLAVNTEVNEAGDGGQVAAKMEQSAMAIFGRAFEAMALQGGTA